MCESASQSLSLYCHPLVHNIRLETENTPKTSRYPTHPSMPTLPYLAHGRCLKMSCAVAHHHAALEIPELQSLLPLKEHSSALLHAIGLLQLFQYRRCKTSLCSIPLPSSRKGLLVQLHNGGHFIQQAGIPNLPPGCHCLTQDAEVGQGTLHTSVLDVRYRKLFSSKRHRCFCEGPAYQVVSPQPLQAPFRHVVSPQPLHAALGMF